MKKNVKLDEREQRMLAMLAQGKSAVQIAKAEGHTFGSIRVYLHKMYKRMGVHNRAEAVASVVPELAEALDDLVNQVVRYTNSDKADLPDVTRACNVLLRLKVHP